MRKQKKKAFGAKGKGIRIEEHTQAMRKLNPDREQRFEEEEGRVSDLTLEIGDGVVGGHDHGEMSIEARVDEDREGRSSRRWQRRASFRHWRWFGFSPEGEAEGL